MSTMRINDNDKKAVIGIGRKNSSIWTSYIPMPLPNHQIVIDVGSSEF